MIHYRIVQIQKPYHAYVSYGGSVTTQSCYEIEATKYENPELANEEIKSRVDGARWVNTVRGIPEPCVCSEDWFIVIQCF